MARENGQATVELLGVIPALLVLGLVAWQLILVGHSAWMSAHAARAAARADLVGEDPREAARSIAGDAVETRRDGSRTRVDVQVPTVRPGWGGSVTVGARASLEAIP